MIWVTGLPRSGTSMRTRQLVAGGVAWPFGEDVNVRPYNPHGIFERGDHMLAPVEILSPCMSDPAVCAKVWPSTGVRILEAGLKPTAALVTERPFDESRNSWAKWFGHFESWDTRADNRARALELFAEHDVPTLTVDFHHAIDHPREDAQRIADFLAPWVTLDVAAMAAVPDPALRHFGAPA